MKHKGVKEDGIKLEGITEYCEEENKKDSAWKEGKTYTTERNQI